MIKGAVDHKSGRFILIQESTSQHCCFQWTIEDTLKTTRHGPDAHGGFFTTNEAVCEGFDEDYGVLVLEALNRA